MNQFMNQLKKTYGFSDYEIKLIRYTLTALLYDFSKLILFGGYYYLTKRFTAFLFCLLPLLLLRTQNGGIHFKKYWSCFLFTFAYLETCIAILPRHIHCSAPTMLIALTICAIINWKLGPNLSNRSGKSDPVSIQKTKCCTLSIVIGTGILLFIYPANKYFIISFWTIILHTIQLKIANILKEIKHHEKSY